MKYTYQLKETNKSNEHIGKYKTYGIALIGNEEIFIDDVSCDEEFVQNTVGLLNDYQVSPTHLFCVVEDLLNV